MGMGLEKLKKKIPTDQPIPEKQGRVRGNKNIFKVGSKFILSQPYVTKSCFKYALDWSNL